MVFARKGIAEGQLHMRMVRTLGAEGGWGREWRPSFIMGCLDREVGREILEPAI